MAKCITNASLLFIENGREISKKKEHRRNEMRRNEQAREKKRGRATFFFILRR